PLVAEVQGVRVAPVRQLVVHIGEVLAECVQPGKRIVTYRAAQVVTPSEFRHRPRGWRDEKRCSDSKNEEDEPAKFRAHPCSPTQVDEPYHTGPVELDRAFHLATRGARRVHSTES